MQIQNLKPGSRFRLRPRVEGRLVTLGSGSAVVDLEIPTERIFTTRTGKRVQILRQVERTTWSLSTEVTPLRSRRGA